MEIKVTSCNTCPFQAEAGQSVCNYDVFAEGNFKISWDGLEASSKRSFKDCPLTTIIISK